MAKGHARVVLLTLLGVGLLAVLLAYVGPGRVVEALAGASPLYLGLALASYLAFFLLRGLRWRMLFSKSAPDVRLSTTTGATAVGWLANSILPLKGGDVLRAALLAKREKVGLVTSASTVALERVLDLLGLAMVAALGLLLLPRSLDLPDGLGRAMEIVWVLPLLSLALLALLVVFRAPTLAFARRTLGRLGKLGGKLVDLLDMVLSGLHALARQPALLLLLLPMTLAVAITQALVFTFLVGAFIPGTPLALAFAGSSVFLLSFVVSVTPGNVGTYEAAFAAVFTALGTPPELAVPAAVLTHLTTTLIVAACGSAALLALGWESARVAWRPARVPQGGAP
jgi:uncharacterized protein (TIRG00374 family)